MTLAECKKLLGFARKNKLVKIKYGDFEAELSPQSWLSRKEQKAFQSLLSPTPNDKKTEDEEVLFWSAK